MNILYSTSLQNISVSAKQILESDKVKIATLINTRDIFGCSAARVTFDKGFFLDSFQYLIDYGVLQEDKFVSSEIYSERRVSENLPSLD